MLVYIQEEIIDKVKLKVNREVIRLMGMFRAVAVYYKLSCATNF